MKKGDFVYYVGNPNKTRELGRVKREEDKTGTLGIVFNSGGNWDYYEDYTAQRVNAVDLVPSDSTEEISLKKKGC